VRANNHIAADGAASLPRPARVMFRHSSAHFRQASAHSRQWTASNFAHSLAHASQTIAQSLQAWRAKQLRAAISAVPVEADARDPRFDVRLFETGIRTVRASSHARIAGLDAVGKTLLSHGSLLFMAVDAPGVPTSELDVQACLARSSMAWSSTLHPASRCSGFASSISLWLMPSLHGTKIIPAGARRAM
jgi:hypothetical protein